MTLLQNLDVILQDPRYLIPVLIWSIAWKGVALWKSARNTQKGWFVVLLVINTLGLLEIAYILWFQRKKK